jgi:ribosomal protein S27AE
MLIVGCQTCGEAKILAGTPDKDGVARVTWTCHRCGTGQVLQLEMAADARTGDLRKILGGLALSGCEEVADGGAPDEAEGLSQNGLGGRVLLR